MVVVGGGGRLAYTLISVTIKREGDRLQTRRGPGFKRLTGIPGGVPPQVLDQAGRAGRGLLNSLSHTAGGWLMRKVNKVGVGSPPSFHPTAYTGTFKECNKFIFILRKLVASAPPSVQHKNYRGKKNVNNHSVPFPPVCYLSIEVLGTIVFNTP